MTIGKVAQAAGVPPSAIRYYESKGLIPRPRRISGVRQYDADVIDHLKILRFYRSSGIPIRGLSAIASGARGTQKEIWLKVMQKRVAELDAWIARAQVAKQQLEEAIECRCNGKSGDCVVEKFAGVRD